MKTKPSATLITLALLATLNFQPSTAFAQGTAFTYQGRLTANGAPANGVYDFDFALFGASSGSSPIGSADFVPGVPVSNGLFTVSLDFGANFPGAARWLEIAVRTNGAGTFNTMNPRQPLTPAPYAIMAHTANSLTSLIVQQNANGAPNIIGGSSGNSVSNGVVGATIAGGGTLDYFGQGPSTNSVTGSFGTVGGGSGNTASAFNATVGGGGFNTASGSGATVGGGYGNDADSLGSTVSGGEDNIADGSDAAIGGGNNNTAYGQASTISGGDGNTVFQFAATVGGGWLNTAVNQYATVPGGYKNTAGGGYSFAAGQRANASHTGAFVWADSQAADFASTSSNQFLIRAQGGVGIGNNNPQAPLHVTGGGDADLGSGGNFISGLASGQNLVIDNNEIISRNNGAASDLILNFGSGNVGIRRNPATNALEVFGEASKSTAGNWLANSDARIKTSVRTVTNALDKLAQVRLVQFRYTDDYRATHPDVEGREYLNVVAQEFQKVFPEDVKRSGEKLANGDDILQVDTYPLTIYSAAAIQELNQELKEKDAAIQSLKTKNDLLAERLGKLEAIVNSLTHKK